MVLQPAIEGMLGLEINAQERKMLLSPQLPPQWDSLHIEHIRMAYQFVNFHYLRSKDGTCEYQFKLDQGHPVMIDFMPSYPAGTRFITVTINGKEVPFTSFKSAQSITLMVSFDLKQAITLIVETEAGISVIPAISDPKPGDPAEGMRILATRLSGNIYQVEVEGKTGSSGILEIWSGGHNVTEAENARFLDQTGRISRFAVDFERSESKYMIKTVTVNIK
jgi:hypothetical protein